MVEEKVFDVKTAVAVLSGGHYVSIYGVSIIP